MIIKDKPADVFPSDQTVAYELYVMIDFPESEKMQLAAILAGVLKSFFHIRINIRRIDLLS